MALRALVLAAGLGKRLRPLTETLPKPLLPVAGRPVLAWTLERLAALGCEAAAINLHHGGEQIRRRFGDSFEGMPLEYSEEASLLGTLGALRPLRSFLGAAELILVINGDSLCRWPLQKLIRKHRGSGAQASLLLSRRADPSRFGGGVGVDRDESVVSFGREGQGEGEGGRDGERGGEGKVERRFVFAGAHALSPSLLHRLGEGPEDFITHLYLPLLREGARVQGVVTGQEWYDLGTPQRYLEGVLGWIRGRGPGRAWRRQWISGEAEVSDGCDLEECAIEAGAQVEKGCSLERVLILPGARVGEGSVVKDSILGPGARVPAGSWVERRLIVLQGRDQRPEPGDSVMGGMLFRPIVDEAGD